MRLPRIFRLLPILGLGALMSGCNYMLPEGFTLAQHRVQVQQGNVLSEEAVRQLRIGMTTEQVKFLMGSPMAEDAFHKTRWEYPYYKEASSEAEESELGLISIHFEEGKVAKIRRLVRIDPEAEGLDRGLAPELMSDNLPDEGQEREYLRAESEYQEVESQSETFTEPEASDGSAPETDPEGETDESEEAEDLGSGIVPEPLSEILSDEDQENDIPEMESEPEPSAESEASDGSAPEMEPEDEMGEPEEAKDLDSGFMPEPMPDDLTDEDQESESPEMESESEPSMEPETPDESAPEMEPEDEMGEPEEAKDLDSGFMPEPMPDDLTDEGQESESPEMESESEPSMEPETPDESVPEIESEDEMDEPEQASDTP